MNFSDSKEKTLKKTKYIPKIIKCYDTFISNDGKLSIEDYFYVHELISKSFHSNKYSNLLKNVNRTLSRKIKLPLELNDFLNYIYKLPIHSKNITLANELYKHFKTHKNEFIRRIVNSYYSFILCVMFGYDVSNKDVYHFNFYEEYNKLKNYITQQKDDNMMLDLFKIVNVFYNCFGNDDKYDDEWECADHIYGKIKTVPKEPEIITTEDEINYHLHWLTHQQQNEFYNYLIENQPCTLIKGNYYNKIANYLINTYIKFNPHLYIINHIQEPATIEVLQDINDFISQEGWEFEDKLGNGEDKTNPYSVDIHQWYMTKYDLDHILRGFVYIKGYTRKTEDLNEKLLDIDPNNAEYLIMYNALFFDFTN